MCGSATVGSGHFNICFKRRNDRCRIHWDKFAKHKVSADTFVAHLKQQKSELHNVLFIAFDIQAVLHAMPITVSLLHLRV